MRIKRSFLDSVYFVIFMILVAAVKSDRHLDSWSGSSECSLKEQAAITRCAEPLYRIKAFLPDSDSQTFTWDFFASRSDQYFDNVCSKFLLFRSCVEPYRELCFYSEPVMSQYGTAVVILEYICGNGRHDILKEMPCLRMAIDQWDMGKCQAIMSSGLDRLENYASPIHQEIQMCNIMRHYSQCIGFPLKRICGREAWTIVMQMIARPSALLIPKCQIFSEQWTKINNNSRSEDTESTSNNNANPSFPYSKSCCLAQKYAWTIFMASCFLLCSWNHF